MARRWRSLAIRLIEPGAKLHPLEILPVYACAFWFATLGGAGEWGTALVGLATTNALLQLVLFAVVVQIPALVTGNMSNVDVAWPTGLVVLASLSLQYAHQNVEHHSHTTDNYYYYYYYCYWHRSFLVGTALLLHGARMALGAFYLFFPFDWPDGDLSRYRYAKQRWILESEETAEITTTTTTGAVANNNLWRAKQQHETIMQAYVNSVFIAAPVLLVATNPNPAPLRPLELAGVGCWLVSWTLENVSDIQMRLFLRATRTNGDASRGTAVIGYAPYDGWRYIFWTKSRHPNYFFEWMCWNSLLLAVVPSALDLLAIESVSLASKIGIVVVMVYVSRLFYDCLLYWTGAQPAESRSVKRRPLYKHYQTVTNVFFPFWVPFFDHHRTPGWPEIEDEHKIR